MSRFDPRGTRPGPAGHGITRRNLLMMAGGLTLGGAASAELLTGSGVRSLAQSGILAGPGQPRIYSCQEWGARDPSATIPLVSQRPQKILVHHTATANRDEVAVADLFTLARAIQNYHMDKEDWADSGQQFTINRGGLIAEGRHRSLDTLRGGRSFPEGSQCTNYNTVSIGIENQGTYTEVEPPQALFSSLTSLCAFACLQYKVDPKNLFGHRDFGDTACPGDKLYALLPTLRTQVAKLLGRPSSPDVTSQLAWPLLRVADKGPQVLAAQHLLRAAGMPVTADGQYGRTTADAVLAFQRRNGDDPSGMIGGASWPRLAVAGHPVGGSPPGDPAGQEVEAAMQSLIQSSRPRAFSVPATLDAQTWQRLLAAAG